jgi:hypothetical protein
MRLSPFRVFCAVLLPLQVFALSACSTESTAPAPTLTIRNATADTLLFRVEERKFAALVVSFTFRDSTASIRGATTPGQTSSRATKDILGYNAGDDIRVTFYRVSLGRIAEMNHVDFTGADLLRSGFAVDVTSGAIQ